MTSKRRSPSRRLSLPCGNVTTSRRHVPRRWRSPTRSISFWRRYARTVPWFRPSIPSMSSSADEYQEILKTKRTREKDFDVWGFLNVLEPYYKGGEYDYPVELRQSSLICLAKRFIVFELDNIQVTTRCCFPIVTIIIMETFISKMRKLKGIRKDDTAGGRHGRPSASAKV